MEWRERVKGEKEPQKYTLQNLCAGVAQDTHTRKRRDKSMQEHKKDKVPGTQPPR